MDPGHPYKPNEITEPPQWPRSEELADHDWAGYYSTLSMLDEQVGRIVRKLKDLGLYDKTLVVVTADSGYMFGSHGYSARQVWFEEAVRVPALARWPGKIKAASRVWSPAVSTDLFPTFLEAAGAPRPERLEAQSLLPALAEPSRPGRQIAYAEAVLEDKGLWQMVRTDRYKFVRFGQAREHLYDVYSDPYERRDLATGARHVDTMDELREVFLKWVEDTPKER
jgi:arylsulfatase A-like enzyme